MLVTCELSSDPCHLLFRFSRAAPLCRIIHHSSLGWAPSGQGTPSPSAQISSPRPTVTPNTHPPLVPRTPAAVDFLTERLPVPQNGTPLRPIVIRYQVHVLALFSGSGSLFPSAPWSFLDHLPPSSPFLAVVWPGRTPRRDGRPLRHRLGRVESRGPPVGATASLARLAQLARLSIADCESATTLAAASAATAA